MAKSDTTRIKFDLPPDYIRAIHVRAAYEDVYPRDLIMQSLDAFLAKELSEVRERMGIQPSAPAKKRAARKD